VAFHAYKDLPGRPGWDGPLGTLALSLQWAVPVFFVLSGFLLYRPFAAAISGGRDRPDAGAFLLRRAARIFPGYWLALIVFGTLAQPDLLWTPDGAVRYGLLLQVFDKDTVYHVLGTAWSLSIEVAFYLALPAIAWLAAQVVSRWTRRGNGPEAGLGVGPHLALVAGLAAGAVALRDAVVAPLLSVAGRDPNLAGFTLAGSFSPFAAGMALAVLTVSRGQVLSALRARRAQLPRTVRAAVAGLLRREGPWLALALLAYSLGLVLEARHIGPWESTDFATLAAVALLAPLVLRPATSHAARLLGGSRALVGLGAVSYGLYLWHWPIQELARAHGFTVEQSILGWAGGFATTATLGIAAAWLSYRFLEAPINDRVRAWTSTGTALGDRREVVGGLEPGRASTSDRTNRGRPERARSKAGRSVASAGS
jgi:peptidoglycan/LPS O-acetylase OafA/YrhL